jgi:hypothetical protein
MDKSGSSDAHKQVVGFGGGIKPRDLLGPTLSKAELVSKLQKSGEEKKSTCRKVGWCGGRSGRI